MLWYVVYQRYNCLGKCSITIFRSCANFSEFLYSACLNSLWTINSSSQAHLGCSCSTSPGVLQISVSSLIPTSLPQAPTRAACRHCHIFIWGSELPPWALRSCLVALLHPAGSCSSASGETILEYANVSKVFLDPFEMKVVLWGLLLYYYYNSTETFEAWVFAWQGWLGNMVDVADASKKTLW